LITLLFGAVWAERFCVVCVVCKRFRSWWNFLLNKARYLCHLFLSEVRRWASRGRSLFDYSRRVFVRATSSFAIFVFHVSIFVRCMFEHFVLVERRVRDLILSLSQLSGSHGEWTNGDDVIFVFFLTLFLITCIPPLLLLCYVFVHLALRVYRVVTMSQFLLMVFSLPFAVFCFNFYCGFLFLGFVFRCAIYSRRGWPILVVLFAFCYPELFGWFLRRTFLAFLNGINGEATNTDDHGPGKFTKKHIRGMARAGARVDAEELDIDPTEFGERPSGAAPTPSSRVHFDIPAPPVDLDPGSFEESEAGSFGDSSESSAPPMMDRVKRDVDVYFMLPDTVSFGWFFLFGLVCVLIDVYSAMLVRVLRWDVLRVDDVVLDQIKQTFDDVVVNIQAFFHFQIHEDIRTFALNRGFGCTAVVSFRPVMPIMFGYIRREYHLNLMTEYNACYAATIDDALSRYLVMRFLSHKDVASTLNVMFEGAKKYDHYDDVDPLLIYNTVLYSYQMKKLQTRTANLARGKCDSQTVQLN